MKTTKAKKTLTGRISNISPERLATTTGDPVTNIDIELTSDGTREFVELEIWGEEGRALVQGKRLSSDLLSWAQFQAPLKVGLRVIATGPYTIKTWKPTKSKSLPKTVKKGCIKIYNPNQLRVVQLPKL